MIELCGFATPNSVKVPAALEEMDLSHVLKPLNIRQGEQKTGRLPPLTSRHTRIALTQKLRRIVDEGAGYGLALEGISTAEVARSAATNG